MSKQPVRVAIVNDYEIVVAGTAAVLAPFAERVSVVELDSRRPVVSDVDVVLYDSFGQVQGSDVDVDALLAHGTARVVIFSWNTDPDLVRRSIAAGAGGYVSKGVDAEQLVDAIERIHAGEVVTPAGAGQPDGDAFGRWPGEEHGLSARESEVLGLICQGLSNEEITRRAWIGMNTVKTHIRNLYRKIGVESRTQAVLWGTEQGFKPDRSRTLRP
ncbi:DNA-binding response regulator [Nocardioides dongxiaopingii]|uniref:response regulator transcription factor n=1 Tax=Nocardioides dongxiaopingii TaxID=2576036 RepID=UPI0010C7657B|nr:response regulator transcription factor [Nocardioides dongxiaopingii]